MRLATLPIPKICRQKGSLQEYGTLLHPQGHLVVLYVQSMGKEGD